MQSAWSVVTAWKD